MECPVCGSSNTTFIASHPAAKVYKCWDCLQTPEVVPYFLRPTRDSGGMCTQCGATQLQYIGSYGGRDCVLCPNCDSTYSLDTTPSTAAPIDGFGIDPPTPPPPHKCTCSSLPKSALAKVDAVMADGNCGEDWWRHSPTTEHIRSALISIFDYLDCRDEKYLARGAFRILAALDVVGVGEQRRCGWCGGPVDGDYDSRGEGEE